MANVLVKWIDKKITSLRKKKRYKKTDTPPPLPYLSNIRPRALTPTPSTLSLSKYIHTGKPVAKPTFFDRFPYEIRRKILIEAFGDSVLHIHLFLGDHEGRPKGAVASSRERHANLNPYRDRLQSDSLTWNHNKWRWHSSVCHRGSPESKRAGLWKLSMCWCLEGSGMCEFWPGEMPRKCFIGAMGWILSCRKAYVEGINVLYATNTIHLASNSLILNLPKLLLPQRLAPITSLEMRWELYPTKSDFSGFHGLVAATTKAFPKLRKLFISLEGQLSLIACRSSPVEDLECDVLRQIDELICKLHSLQTFRLDLISTLYKLLRSSLKQGENEISSLRHSEPPVWRDTYCTEKPTESHLPGYWIHCGLIDHPPWDPIPCFGTGFL